MPDVNQHQDSAAAANALPTCASLQVMFDGSCPLCRREVGLYRDLKASSPIQWVDVSDPALALLPSTERAAYMARFHVRTPDGVLLSGAAAFVALWLTLPGWRWLGRFGSLPGMTYVLEYCYRGFLHGRPLIQRLVRRLERAG